MQNGTQNFFLVSNSTFLGCTRPNWNITIAKLNLFTSLLCCVHQVLLKIKIKYLKKHFNGGMSEHWIVISEFMVDLVAVIWWLENAPPSLEGLQNGYCMLSWKSVKCIFYLFQTIFLWNQSIVFVNSCLCVAGWHLTDKLCLANFTLGFFRYYSHIDNNNILITFILFPPFYIDNIDTISSFPYWQYFFYWQYQYFSLLSILTI